MWWIAQRNQPDHREFASGRNGPMLLAISLARFAETALPIPQVSDGTNNARLGRTRPN